MPRCCDGCCASTDSSIAGGPPRNKSEPAKRCGPSWGASRERIVGLPLALDGRVYPGAVVRRQPCWGEVPVARRGCIGLGRRRYGVCRFARRPLSPGSTASTSVRRRGSPGCHAGSTGFVRWGCRAGAGTIGVVVAVLAGPLGRAGSGSSPPGPAIGRSGLPVVLADIQKSTKACGFVAHVVT
jgi:hypothetical protein